MSPAEAVAARLRQLSLAEGLSDPALEALLAHAHLRAADAGECRVPGEGGLLVLTAGRLELRRRDDDRPIAALGPGDTLVGGGALAREVALWPDRGAEWLEIDAAGSAALERCDAEAFARLARRLAPGERRLQLAIHLSRLFTGLALEGLEELGAGVEWLSLRGGELLFREGDPADAAYVVLSGRLRAVAGPPGEERELNEVTAGETVGEMALLQDDVRSASVFAVRDAQLARLDRKVFDALTERHPQALRRIAGFVVDRLRRHSSERPRPRSALAIAVVPARTGLDTGPLVAGLAAELRGAGATEVVDRRAVERALGRAGAADARDEESAGIALVRWLGERDGASRHVLYAADAEWTPWTERALRQADQVLIVARAEDGPGKGEIEARLAELWARTRAPHRSLVLLHPPGREPRGTRAWLAQRDVDRHFHVCGDDPGAIPRLARLVTGRGRGLVLGGGGARGFAHLGVLRALEQAEVPIDAVGGTSMGAIVAALPAMGLDAAAAREVCRRYVSALFDPTVPVVSLLTGRRIGARLSTVFGERDVEDLRLPFFCVSTNLSRAQAVVHDRDDLFRAVRSSISLPGILPPISIDGDLHVDGGLLDNLPIETMAARWGGPVVAVDVSPEVDLRSELDLARGVSGWRMLGQRLNPFASRAPGLDVPTITSVLMRSVVVASLVKERERRAAEAASLHLKLPVEEWGLLEFEKLDPIADRGYEASAEPVRAWWAEQGAPRPTSRA